MKKVTKSLEETHALAAEFVGFLLSSNFNLPSSATVVAMHGDLGSGKTAFVQGVAKALGVEQGITSPTFVLQKIYETPKGRLVHIDAYRLNSGADLKPLRFAETLADPQTIVFLEWPEIVQDAMPPHAIPLKFKFIDENTREIDLPEF